MDEKTRNLWNKRKVDLEATKCSIEKEMSNLKDKADAYITSQRERDRKVTKATYELEDKKTRISRKLSQAHGEYESKEKSTRAKIASQYLTDNSISARYVRKNVGHNWTVETNIKPEYVKAIVSLSVNGKPTNDLIESVINSRIREKTHNAMKFERDELEKHSTKLKIQRDEIDAKISTIRMSIPFDEKGYQVHEKYKQLSNDLDRVLEDIALVDKVISSATLTERERELVLHWNGSLIDEIVR